MDEAGKQQPQVRLEDQRMINEFGLNVQRMEELNNEVSDLKADYEAMEDIEDEMLLSSGSSNDSLRRIKMGDGFVHVDEEYFDTFIEQMQEKVKDKMKKLTEELATLTARQSELKKILYGRFGSNINLEL